jgi:hypothetical protein
MMGNKKKLCIGLAMAVCLSSLSLIILCRFVNENTNASIVGNSALPFRGVYGESIVLTCDLPNVPTEIPRLKVLYDSEMGNEKVEEIAEGIFNFTGEASEAVPGVLHITTSTQSLSVYRCGAIRYFDELLSGPQRTQPNLPSYEEAEVIGEGFLETIKAHGLVPGNSIQLTFKWVGPLSESTILRMGENGDWEVVGKIVDSLGVKFGLEYKGFEMWGPGAKVTVEIGENGEIASFTGFWKGVEEEGTSSILTPGEALERLSSEGYAVKLDDPKEVTINRVTLGYYVRSVGSGEDYLQPAYLLDITLDGENSHITAAISATDENLSY